MNLLLSENFLNELCIYDYGPKTFTLSFSSNEKLISHNQNQHIYII